MPKLSSMHISKSTLAILYLGIIYLVGIVGILLPIHPEFIRLTPLNLLVSLVTVLVFHPQWSKASVWALAVLFVIGFFAEVFGVKTGLLFGTYTYGEVLGWKLWDTPLMIGINWMLLGYCCGVTINHLAPNWAWWKKGPLAAALMVMLDLFIEPVAIAYNFWEWPGDIVPLQNYIGWYLVSLPLLLLFAYLQGQIRNKVAVALLWLQFAFFIVLRLF
jgi:bisanhydrobacterioruberin hydratase